MKPTHLPDSTETAHPAATNGTHRVSKKNGAAPKPAVGTDAPADARAPEPLAGPVASIEAAPVDAPMWPLHSAIWFQPDVAPSAPAWSGLAIEHRNRIPAPDFLRSDIAPLNRPDALDNSPHALTPDASPGIPQSGLAPLGWDPRAVCWKEGGR